MNDKIIEMQKQLQSVIDKRAENERHQQNLQGLRLVDESVSVSINKLIQYLQGSVTKTEVLNQIESVATPDVAKVVSAIEKLLQVVDGKEVDLTPVVKALGGVEAQLKALPAQFPEAPEQREDIRVSNLAEIDFKPLEKAVKALKLNPEINVTPDIQVEAPNLTPIKDALADVIDAIKAIPQPAPTDTKKIEKHLDDANKKLQKLIDKPTGSGGSGGGNGTPYVNSAGAAVNVELSNGAIPQTEIALAKKITVVGSITYIASAVPGSAQASAVWQVKKIDESVAGTTVITWADGDGNYDNEATDLTALTYS